MTFRCRVLLTLACVTALLLHQPVTSGYSIDQPLQDSPGSVQRKVAPWVLEHTGRGEQTEALVILADAADLQAAATLRSKLEKGRFVRDTLFEKAQQTQAPLVEWLRTRGVEHRSFYIVNAIWIRTTRDVVMEIAARPDVARIEGNPRIVNIKPVELTEAERQAIAEIAAPEAIEPGVTYIRAPEVWSQGFTGQGIVIGGADTGVLWDHAALKNHYRGWNGSSANHDYNWHDSIHSGGGACGPNSAVPCDDHGHGTHTLGTAVGDDGGTNQIGVAPGAKFIGCRNMDQGVGTPATYIECMEWFLAPYPVGGTPAQGDSTKAPDITNNSWGCPPSEGCSAGTLQSAVESQRAAGIMTVVAAGNDGPSCSTVADPPSIYDAAYTVGAFSASTGTIAFFSSRGPVTVDGSNRLKPDITAPGVSVRSATIASTTSYGLLSGTSMAAPHVAGAVALLWSARAELRHQITNTENVLNESAVEVPLATCTAVDYPNNVYGFGRLDVKAAVDLATALTLNIAGVAPKAGRTAGGQQVVLTGLFLNLSSVSFGGVAASWTYTNGTSEITVTTPPHGAGAVDITLTPTAGASYTRTNGFAFLPTTFTDNTLVAGVTVVKAQHIVELRQSVDAMRAVAGLAPASWVDPVLLASATSIKALHILELRAYLEDAASRLGYSAGSYTDPALAAGTLIKRIHVEELRQRIRNIAG